MLFFGNSTKAQLNPVKWYYKAEKLAEGEYDLVFTAHIQPGWYVYSRFLSSDEGPIPTSFYFDENEAVSLVGQVEENGHRHEGYDDLFAMQIVKYSDKPTFTQRVLMKSPTQLTGYLEFMTCDEERCLPPAEVPFSFILK